MEPNLYLIRATTVDGIILFEYAGRGMTQVDSSWKWYEAFVLQADDGAIVQLISVADDLVIGETIVGS